MLHPLQLLTHAALPLLSTQQLLSRGGRTGSKGRQSIASIPILEKLQSIVLLRDVPTKLIVLSPKNVSSIAENVY